MLLHMLTVNAMNYDLHIHILPLKYFYDFFTEFSLFQPFADGFADSPPLLLPENNHAIFGVPDWLLVHSEEEWYLEPLGNRVSSRAPLALLELVAISLSYRVAIWDHSVRSESRVTEYNIVFTLKEWIAARIELEWNHSQFRAKFSLFRI